MPVEFDSKKEQENLKNHGVSFTEGDGVLNDPLAITVEDISAEGEARFITPGSNVFGRLMVVVWTEREREDESLIRLISVRAAEPKERKVYEKKP
jgi:uncharacterized protein